MDRQTGLKGFLVVLPGDIIEIPQDSDKSWLTLFYSLPRELAEKWKPAYELPRCPYSVADFQSGGIQPFEQPGLPDFADRRAQIGDEK